MEIAIGIFFLAIIGVTLLVFAGLIAFIIWRTFKRRGKNNQRKNFRNDSGDSETDYDDSPTSNYSSAGVIIPAAAAAIVGSEIINNSQESHNQTSGGSWEYTDYGTADAGNSDGSSSDSSSDSGASCSSGSSCSSCGGGSSD